MLRADLSLGTRTARSAAAAGLALVALIGSRFAEPAHATVTLGAGPFSEQAAIAVLPNGPGSAVGSVGISGDGNTAIVGVLEQSALVFVRSGSSWAEQTHLPLGHEPDSFGQAVAISADGNTALVGGGSGGWPGEAEVFFRSGTTWTQQAGWGRMSLGSREGGSFGSSVALSADGNTALLGYPNDPPSSQEGAAGLFTRSQGQWTQSAQPWRGSGEITSGGTETKAEFGARVALSADGSVAFVSGPGDNELRGAVWAFERSGSGWVERGKLTPSDEVGREQFGISIALSAHGETALIGSEGAAWVFARSGNGWGQQGQRLTNPADPTEYIGHFGWTLALSGDGNTALFGDEAFGEEHNGAAWIYRRSGATFSQLQQLTGSPATRSLEFGSRVALSADGTTALVTAPKDGPPAAGAGLAYVFVGPPSASFGTFSGGNPLSPTPLGVSSLTITRFAESHRRWREGTKLARVSRRSRLPVGTTFSFTLNEPATVTLVFAQPTIGREVSGRCAPKTRRNRRAKACRHLVAHGGLVFRGHTGTNKISFGGRMTRRRWLPLGHYLAAIAAKDASGRRSRASSVRFFIVR